MNVDPEGQKPQKHGHHRLLPHRKRQAIETMSRTRHAVQSIVDDEPTVPAHTPRSSSSRSQRNCKVHAQQSRSPEATAHSSSRTNHRLSPSASCHCRLPKSHTLTLAHATKHPTPTGHNGQMHSLCAPAQKSGGASAHLVFANTAWESGWR